jgi:hypothetical protein
VLAAGPRCSTSSLRRAPEQSSLYGRVRLKRPRMPLSIGDVPTALVVIGLLAAGSFGLWRLYQGLTTFCIRLRYDYDCLPDEPWSFTFSMVINAVSALAALGSATFIAYLRICERP